MKDNIKIINGLVDLEQLDDTFIIDIKYATEDNFLGKKVYPAAKCILRLGTANKLIAANNEFKKHGLRIKIFDGYRPLSIQRIMWEYLPNDNFVAPPTRGSKHNRGAAVDVTLVDRNARELEMPSQFDDFSEKAFVDYKKGSKKAIENREFLAEIMVKQGFQRISSEWWHFDDSECMKYPLEDIGFEEFI